MDRKSRWGSRWMPNYGSFVYTGFSYFRGDVNIASNETAWVVGSRDDCGCVYSSLNAGRPIMIFRYIWLI